MCFVVSKGPVWSGVAQGQFARYGGLTVTRPAHRWNSFQATRSIQRRTTVASISQRPDRGKMHALTFPCLFCVANRNATICNCSFTLHATNCLKPVSPLCSQPHNTFQTNSANDGCKSQLFDKKRNNSSTQIQVSKYQVYQMKTAHPYRHFDIWKLYKCNQITYSKMRLTTLKLLLLWITFKG